MTAKRLPGLTAIAVCGLAGALLAGCGASGSGAASADGAVIAVGAENQYANVIAQIGGKYVKVSAVESNPNTDPHSFEASPSVAQQVGAARLVVQNGLGYDTYMEKIEAASPSSARKVIDVQKLLDLPDSTPNPHLWYKPQTMPAVARALAADLSALQPAHAAYFKARAAAFERSLAPWRRALARFAAEYPGTAVATTEPVGDYMLEAAGTHNLTPFSLQADIMNGVEPGAARRDAAKQPAQRPQGQGLRLQPAGRGLAHAVLPGKGESRRRAGSGGIRDDAHAGLRLPVVDARRGPGAAPGGRRGHLDGETLMVEHRPVSIDML